MNKKKGIIISIIVVVLIIIAVGIAFVYSAKKEVEIAQKEYEEKVEKYGSVERETVDTVIAKFNTEIMDSGLNTPATNESMVTEDGLYWYALTENISCYVRPVEFTGDHKTDNAELISIYFDKEGYKEETAINYWKKLIKANKVELTNEEINTLVEDAKANKDSEEMTANGKGIYAAIIETDNHYEYQVKRLYK